MNKRTIPIDVVKQRLRVVHGTTVSLIESSYQNYSTKAQFLDVEFGLWFARVGHVCGGSRHPSRGKLVQAEKFKASYTLLDVDAKRKRTNLLRHGVEFPAQSHTIYAKVIATNINKYGVSNPMQNSSVFMKNKRLQKRSFVVKHWKTDEDLLCTARWEKAFVDWMNYHQYEFVWQRPYKLPNGSTYFVDAYVSTGPLANNWIEIKGFWYRKSKTVSEQKWLTLNTLEPNSLLLQQKELNALGVLNGKLPNRKFES